MAMNPMQRRARNSFLIGFLIALVVMAVVVVMLLQKINKLNDSIASIKAKLSQQYIAGEDLNSGEVVDMDSFIQEEVQTTIDSSEFVSDEDFILTDKNGELIYNEDGTAKEKEMMLKIDVPAGTIITKDMLVETGDKVTDTDRIQEYNMIALPSQLKNGDYIYIRISLSNGQDYVVLTKKRVLGTTSTSIWMRMNEFELELLNSAIVESYIIEGAKLYAIEYVEPGLQKAATSTYAAGQDTLTLMQNNPNIIDEALTQYNSYAQFYTPEVAAKRVNAFETALQANADNRAGLVSTGNAAEVQAVQSAREEYISALEGSEDVGYTQD